MSTCLRIICIMHVGGARAIHGVWAGLLEPIPYGRDEVLSLDIMRNGLVLPHLNMLGLPFLRSGWDGSEKVGEMGEKERGELCCYVKQIKHLKRIICFILDCEESLDHPLHLIVSLLYFRHRHHSNRLLEIHNSILFC